MLAVLITLWLLPPGWGVGRLRPLLSLALYLTVSIAVARLLVHAFRKYIRLFLWRVRNRMIAVYVFVGLIPLLLVIVTAVLGLSLVAGPLAAYMVNARIGQRAASLQAAAASLGWDMRASEPSERPAALRAFIDNASEIFPQVMVRIDLPNRAFALPDELAEGAIPAAVREHQGIAEHRGKLFLCAYAQYAPGAPSVLLLVPLTDEYLRTFLPRLGPLQQRGPPGSPPNPARFQEIARLVPPPTHPFDYALPWVVEAPVLSWETGEAVLRPDLSLVTRPSAVAGAIFGSQARWSAETLRFGVGALGVLFGAALLVSLFVAVSLTRTLTRAVYELHAGTERINVGDFSYRAPIHGDDQLAALAGSFNSMAASIESLIVESKERQRLQSELEIAREVQSQLFPRFVPHLQSVEVLGLCRAAQSVSGDFYDYVELPPSRLALAFGDVSGKGISAALVMATLHSLIRAQLSLLAQLHGDDETLRSTSQVIAQVNQQLHMSTAADKFATLFFATFDQDTNTLIYSNAGHLPPILIRDHRASRLDVHGMVVGAFPHSLYSSSLLRLEAGDLVVAFTDGITEPQNAYGDEFGEDRLADLLLRQADQPVTGIIDTVMREIDLWTGSPALQDDRTMLVLRRH